MPSTPSTPAVRAACVVVAAGSGSRLGADRPKAFVELAGTPLLRHAVDRVLASDAVGHVVVVVPEQWLDRARELLGDGTAHGATSGNHVATRQLDDSGAVTRQPDDDERRPGVSPTPSVTVVTGGAERQDSVAAGLAALPDDVELVLVHDAARCLAPPSLVARVVEAVRAGHSAVVPGLPVADTVKLVGATGSDGTGSDAEPVRETVDRGQLRIAQTPQGFDRATLDAAHTAARAETAQVLAPVAERFGAAAATAALAPVYTDDAEMAELVTEVVVVPGDALAFKITGPQDLAYAEWVLSRAEPPP